MAGQRVVGYVRVSTEKQANHGVSLEAQQDKIRQYAALYDLTLIDIVIEAGSAKSLKRSGLQQALGMLTSGKATGIVVVKLDRLTRSLEDLGFLIRRYFSRYDLMAVIEQIDTATANGRMALNLLMTVSQWEREVIGERTKDALRHKKAHGEKTGGECPYGYRAIDGKLVADPDEQAMLAKIRQYRTEGYSLREIATELQRQGYTTRKGTRFQPAQIARILKEVA